ncbi:MAG: dihydrofolate reductase family protein [Methanococcaceae archaeon]
MHNYVFIACSLDGYIARKDGNIDWLNDIPNPDKSDFGYGSFIRKIDAVVMGRKTYEKVLTFTHWPYVKPAFVLSNTLKTVPPYLKSKIEIISGDLREAMEMLEARKLNSFYIDGGITIQNFLKEDLIDEMIITRLPVLLGDGLPLFGPMNSELKFKHELTEVLHNTIVQSRYKRIR